MTHSVLSSLNAAGRVYRIAGTIELDERVSWCPPGVRRRQNICCYAIVGEQGALIVDTGVRLHERLVLDQLTQVLPTDIPVSVLLTRTEMECCLNLPAIEKEFEVSEVWYTGGITIPAALARTRRVSVEPGTSQPIEPAPGMEIELVSPRLRLLPTLWVYVPDSQILLTSDGFTYGHDGPSDPNDGLVKFTWINETDTRAIAEDLHGVVHNRKVSAIAPGYGEPFIGRDTCRAAAAEFAHAVSEKGLRQ